ncbi:MAG: aminotransferase class V-fold PLP-dependent enzyme [Chloroflexota bacterium]
MVGPFMPDAEKVAAVREALPAVGAGIYLNTGSAGPLPAEVAAVMAELEGWELRTGRASAEFFEDFLDRLAEARASVAAILATDVDAIAITHSTTEGMNIATWAVDWKVGDRIVTTNHEHAGGLGPLVAARERFGLDLVLVDVGDSEDDDATLAAFDAAITPGTRLVAFSHVLWTTGARLPVERIARLAKDRGATVAVDGAQAVGAVPVAVDDLGVDFYAVAAQKWLLGPEGIGALWASRAALDRAQPSLTGWFSFDGLTLEGAGRFHDAARRFEATNYHKPSVTGFARACGWLSMYVGLPWVHDRGQALAASAFDRLARIPGVTIVTPRDRMATLVTFRIAGWPADAAVAELGSRVFAITRTIPPLDAIRISVGFFNASDEIERFAGAVELLAGHTPESIPPKPRLTIIGQGA